MKLKTYYQHNSTRAQYSNGYKFLMGDELYVYEDGSFNIKRDGVVLHTNMDDKKEESKPDVKVKIDVQKKSVNLKRMTRSQLDKYAKDKFNVDLDGRRAKKDLIIEIEKLMKGE